MAEAKKRARAMRVRNIRRRIACGATVMVAVFSGAILFRSLEQEKATATAPSVATRSNETDDSGAVNALVAQVSSVLDEGDDEEASSSGAVASSGSSTTTTTTPLTTSQS